MNTNENFLHCKRLGITICFTNRNGTVTLGYQRTLDPNEDLDEDTMSVEDARKEWKNLWKQGYRKATGWHTCKRDSAWANNGDEYGDD